MSTRRNRSLWSLSLMLVALAALLVGMSRQPTTVEPNATAAFPAELTEFTPAEGNPIFTAAGPGHWDVKIRERGWILRDGDQWHLWYTGYDGTREGIRQLGYATSRDGIHWERYAGNPLVAGHWVEDMMVVRSGDTYYMFAEGRGDRAELLTSKDPIHWQTRGTLDIHYTDGRPLSAGPFGTPTAWLEDGTWHLFYERMDQGVWLATSRDLKTWTNVQDEPVLRPGPGQYDRLMIAMNQIYRQGDRYYAYYHGTGDPPPKRTWNTCLAVSDDLVHWTKFPGNPLLTDKSSGVILSFGGRMRLYTMHDQVDLYLSDEP